MTLGGIACRARQRQVPSVLGAAMMSWLDVLERRAADRTAVVVEDEPALAVNAAPRDDGPSAHLHALEGGVGGGHPQQTPP